jgi:hypothetical protein
MRKATRFSCGRSGRNEKLQVLIVAALAAAVLVGCRPDPEKGLEKGPQYLHKPPHLPGMRKQ